MVIYVCEYRSRQGPYASNRVYPIKIHPNGLLPVRYFCNRVARARRSFRVVEYYHSPSFHSRDEVFVRGCLPKEGGPHSISYLRRISSGPSQLHVGYATVLGVIRGAQWYRFTILAYLAMSSSTIGAMVRFLYPLFLYHCSFLVCFFSVVVADRGCGTWGDFCGLTCTLSLFCIVLFAMVLYCGYSRCLGRVPVRM